MTPPPPLPAKGLRISRKTGFHIDFTVLAEFHIHDVVIIALDHRCLSRTPKWNHKLVEIQAAPVLTKKTKSITNSQSKDIRYGAPCFWNSFEIPFCGGCHLKSFTIWAKRWSHGGGCRKPFTLQMIFNTFHVKSREESPETQQHVPHHKQPTKSHTKDYQKKGVSKTHQTKSLKWVTIFKDDHQNLPRMSLWVNLWHSTLKTPNPKVYPTVSGIAFPIQVTNSGNGPYNHCLTDIASGMSTIHMTPDFMIFHPVEDTNGPKFLCLPGNLLEACFIWIFFQKPNTFCWFCDMMCIMSMYNPPTFKTFQTLGPPPRIWAFGHLWSHPIGCWKIRRTIWAIHTGL